MGVKLSPTNIIQRGANRIKSLYLGNRLLWQSDQNEDECVFEPIVMDSQSYIKTSFDNETYAQFWTTGNTTFIIKPKNNIKLSDVDITNVYSQQGMAMTQRYPICMILRLDDYALYVNYIYGWNSWPGGEGGYLREYHYLKYFNQDRKTIYFNSETDEDNTNFINGLYVNKVIKVPACGSSGIVNTQFFPLDFNSSYYLRNSFDLYYVKFNEPTRGQIIDENTPYTRFSWDNEDKVFNIPSTDIVIPLSATILSSLNTTYGKLNGKIEYTIKPNDTNEFRDIALCTTNAMIHFVQEPHNDHRIYIGDGADKNYLVRTTKYIDSPSFENEYLFHMCGSKIIERTITFNIDYKKIIMYPTSIENDYDVVMSGDYTYIDTYIWDNLEYKHYVFEKYAKITFKKK